MNDSIKQYQYDIVRLLDDVDSDMPFEKFIDHFGNCPHPSYP